MCEECNRIARQINPDHVTAIEAHRAEIVELFTQITTAASPKAMQDALEETPGSTPEQFALSFAPYVIGFLCGGEATNQDDMGFDRSAFSHGHQHGHAWKNRQGH